MMIQKMYRRKRIFSILLLLIIITSGGITLLWQLQQKQSTRAASQRGLDAGNVIGGPSLSGATVDAIFARMGSPMVGTGSVVEQVSRQTQIDDAFAMGVWYVETSDGAAGVGRADHNPGSIRGTAGYPSAYDGYTVYPSYAAAIVDWFNVLNNRYIARGLNSAYSICYPYVGTASSYQWAVKVVTLMYRYRGEAPPVTATPDTGLTATVSAAQVQARTHQLIRPIRTNRGNTTLQGQVQASQQGIHKTGQGEEINRTGRTSSIAASPLPELPIVGLGLSLALIIALSSLFINRTQRASTPREEIEAFRPTTEALTPFMFAPSAMVASNKLVSQLNFPDTNELAPITQHIALLPTQPMQAVNTTNFAAANGLTPLPEVRAAINTEELSGHSHNGEAVRRGIRPPLRLRPLLEEEMQHINKQQEVEQVLVVATPARRALLQRYGEHQQQQE